MLVHSARTAVAAVASLLAARCLTMNGQRRLMGSFNHGSMANALPQAIGAQVDLPPTASRVFVGRWWYRDPVGSEGNRITLNRKFIKLA